MGRPPERTAEVRPEAERRATGDDGRGLPSARATDRHRPQGIPGLPEQRIPRVAEHGELGAVRLAEKDGAGPAQTGHGRRVGLRNESLQQRRPSRHADASGRDHVLDGERHPGQRQFGPIADRRVHLGGLFPRLLGPQRDDRVQIAVYLSDPFQVSINDLPRGRRPVADQSRQLGRGVLDEICGDQAPPGTPASAS